MKAIITSAMFLCCISAAYSQQHFGTATLLSENGRQHIQFTVPRENNIRYYRIEAGNDTTNLQVIGTVPTQGNTVFANHYHYEVSAYDYTYYRVAQVHMNGNLPYSPILSATIVDQPRPAKEPENNPAPIVSSNTPATEKGF